MSRFYEARITITRHTPFTKQEFSALCEFHSDEMTVIDQQLTEGTVELSGNCSLSGGEGEQDAHRRLVKEIRDLIGPCSVTTRWTYLEELPYVEYSTDEDEEEGAAYG